MVVRGGGVVCVGVGDELGGPDADGVEVVAKPMIDFVEVGIAVARGFMPVVVAVGSLTSASAVRVRDGSGVTIAPRDNTAQRTTATAKNPNTKPTHFQDIVAVFPVKAG